MSLSQNIQDLGVRRQSVSIKLVQLLQLNAAYVNPLQSYFL